MLNQQMKLGLSGSVNDYWADMNVRINPLPLAQKRMDSHEETLDLIWAWTIQAPGLTTSDRINLQDQAHQCREDIACLNVLMDMDTEIEVLQGQSIRYKEKHREIVTEFKALQFDNKQLIDSYVDEVEEKDETISSLEMKIEEKDQDIVDAVMELKADIDYIITEKLAGLPS